MTEVWISPNAPVMSFKTFFARIFVASRRSFASRLFSSRFSCRFNRSSISDGPSKLPPLPAPTHHHQPRKLCQRTTAHMRLGSQTYSSSRSMYKKLRAVDMRARERAAVPKTAVPPSVRQAWRRLTKNPQMKRAIVNRRERAALQTLRTAQAIVTAVDGSTRPCTGMSTAASMASGPAGRDCQWHADKKPGRQHPPSKTNISLPSRREG